MDEIVSNYRKLRYFIKHANIPLNIKDIGIYRYGNNMAYITYKKNRICHSRWWNILDELLVWDTTKEGLYFWYEQHLKLLFYAMVVSDNNEHYFFNERIGFILENRFINDPQGAKIKSEFIKNCEKSNLIDKRFISGWREKMQ